MDRDVDNRLRRAKRRADHAQMMTMGFMITALALFGLAIGFLLVEVELIGIWLGRATAGLEGR